MAASGKTAEELMAANETEPMRRVRACLALISTATLPTGETDEAIERDIDMNLIEKAITLFPAREMSMAGRMADALAEHFSAISDFVDRVLLETDNPPRSEQVGERLHIHLNEPPPKRPVS